jgi:hypothetical protein
MLRDPVAAETETIAKPCEINAVCERLGTGHALGNRGLIQHAEGKPVSAAWLGNRGHAVQLAVGAGRVKGSDSVASVRYDG